MRNKPDAIKPITAPLQILKRSLNARSVEVVFVPTDHRFQCINVKHQTNPPSSILITGLDGFHLNGASTLNDQVIGGGHQNRRVASPFSNECALGTSPS